MTYTTFVELKFVLRNSIIIILIFVHVCVITTLFSEFQGRRDKMFLDASIQ